MQVLSMEPSDYSYFNKALLRSWAGPAHWKAGHLSKGELILVGSGFEPHEEFYCLTEATRL